MFVISRASWRRRLALDTPPSAYSWHPSLRWSFDCRTSRYHYVAISEKIESFNDTRAVPLQGVIEKKPRFDRDKTEELLEGSGSERRGKSSRRIMVAPDVWHGSIRCDALRQLLRVWPSGGPIAITLLCLYS
jgi:hypothetical protein